jgi:hypothetical protein
MRRSGEAWVWVEVQGGWDQVASGCVMCGIRQISVGLGQDKGKIFPESRSGLVGVNNWVPSR